ncbi:hypothetical protein Mapa_013648 [Marchantia paleacea]|nr:hypothetical protein Mapa_013648 [Marchantia paleacea]
MWPRDVMTDDFVPPVLFPAWYTEANDCPEDSLPPWLTLYALTSTVQTEVVKMRNGSNAFVHNAMINCAEEVVNFLYLLRSCKSVVAISAMIMTSIYI